MPHIRPISDLRNHFTDIAKIVDETKEPVFLTKNGYGVMVVMSIDAYEEKMFESEHYHKLNQELEEASNQNKENDE
jgi:prevent-host-death family protein